MGSLFALSPFAFVALAGGHLMLSALALLPLMAGCLDELLLPSGGAPDRVGAVLGLLVVVQFFLGTEMLLIVVASALLGIALLAVYGLAVDRAQVARRAPPRALAGLRWPRWSRSWRWPIRCGSCCGVRPISPAWSGRRCRRGRGAPC